MAQNLTTADQILACARGLIVAGGYNGFSYADVAKVVGIRKASIHHHFPAKADLVRALVADYRAQTESGLAQIAESTPDAATALKAYAGYWERCIAEASLPFCVCALLATEAPVLPAEVAAEVRLFVQRLSAWTTAQMERGVADGTLRPAELAAIEAEAFLAAVHGAMLLARAHDRSATFAMIVEPALRRLTPT